MYLRAGAEGLCCLSVLDSALLPNRRSLLARSPLSRARSLALSLLGNHPCQGVDRSTLAVVRRLSIGGWLGLEFRAPAVRGAARCVLKSQATSQKRPTNHKQTADCLFERSQATGRLRVYLRAAVEGLCSPSRSLSALVSLLSYPSRSLALSLAFPR